jgi:hypothetical protein
MKTLYDAGDQGLQPCDAHSVTRDKDRRVMVSIRVEDRLAIIAPVYERSSVRALACPRR